MNRFFCIVITILSSNAYAVGGNGNGNEPPGDIYSCVQDNRSFLVGTQDIDATFERIETRWSCLSIEEQALCKEVTVMVYQMHMKRHTESSINNAIYAKGAWTAGLCK